jgi:polyhydroxyalkanoate synthase
MTQAPDTESERQLLRLAAGVRLAFQSTPAPVGTMPRQIVGYRGKARLYYYAPTTDEVVKSPLVLFPYLGISRPYVFDLRPGESFAQFLMANGVPFYLCDWGVFGPEDREVGITDIVADRIPALLDQALEHAGASEATLFGYCMGVPMTACALARDSSLPVRNYLAMVGPIDFGEGEFTEQTGEDRFDVDAVVETFDMMPAEFVRSGFKLLNPMGDAQQAKNLAENMWNAEWLKGYRAMNRWAEEWVPLPKQFFRQWVRHFYQGNELVKGEFRVDGRRVDLGKITQPTLCISAARDDIVPPASAKALIDVIGSTDKTYKEMPGGHISVIAGRRAREDVWPSVLQWLRDHD